VSSSIGPLISRRLVLYTPPAILVQTRTGSMAIAGPPSQRRASSFQIERARAGGLAVRHRPEELELQAIGILGVERQARAVIGLADQGARRDEPLARPRQIRQLADLPGRVVHARNVLVRSTDTGVLEEAEVMIVDRSRDLQERRLRIPALDLEAEHVDVEPHAALDVGDVEDEVLQPPEAEAGHVATIFLISSARSARLAGRPVP